VNTPIPIELQQRMLSGIAALVQAGCCLFATTGVYANQTTCGALNITQFGPYDYRTQSSLYKVVVDHHFTPDIEALLIRSNGLPPGGDLSYTLRSIPNHHRALVAVTRYGQRWNDKGLQFSVECYFDRAVRFRPDDTIVRGLYANFLASKNRRDEAATQLDAAVFHAGENPLSHYNIGLIYAELGQFDKALAQAHKVIALGSPGAELENQLRRAGKWQDAGQPQAPR
jgi:hypothetical protein